MHHAFCPNLFLFWANNNFSLIMLVIPTDYKMYFGKLWGRGVEITILAKAGGHSKTPDTQWGGVRQSVTHEPPKTLI